jgi:pyrroline-5-carboxylate reductase
VSTRRIALLGGGRMGEALLGGWLAAGVPAAGLAVVEVVPARRDELVARFPGVAVVAAPADLGPAPVGCAEVVVVAVKPHQVAEALGAADPAADALVVSIAAGVRIATLEAAAPGRPVVRAMPNTPALVGRGVTAIAPGVHAGPAHLDLAEQLLGAVGTVVRTGEAALDAVTGLSGSGPAYVFLMVEALVEAGVAEGLPRDLATTLAVGTLVGAAALLDDGAGRPDPAALREAVTSPGGTTAAGLRALEDRAFRAAIAAAVEAATRRSRELGG